MSDQPSKLRVFIDADVLFAGAASPNAHSAGLVVLQMAEITLIDAITPEQVISEAKRNLETKIARALATFELLVDRCLTVVPSPSREDLSAYRGLVGAKDLPILVAAIQSRSSWLVTFNARLYQPGHPSVGVARPGKFDYEGKGLPRRTGLDHDSLILHSYILPPRHRSTSGK